MKQVAGEEEKSAMVHRCLENTEEEKRRGVEGDEEARQEEEGMGEGGCEAVQSGGEGGRGFHSREVEVLLKCKAGERGEKGREQEEGAGSREGERKPLEEIDRSQDDEEREWGRGGNGGGEAFVEGCERGRACSSSGGQRDRAAGCEAETGDTNQPKAVALLSASPPPRTCSSPPPATSPLRPATSPSPPTSPAAAASPPTFLATLDSQAAEAWLASIKTPAARGGDTQLVFAREVTDENFAPRHPGDETPRLLLMRKSGFAGGFADGSADGSDDGYAEGRLLMSPWTAFRGVFPMNGTYFFRETTSISPPNTNPFAPFSLPTPHHPWHRSVESLPL